MDTLYGKSRRSTLKQTTLIPRDFYRKWCTYHVIVVHVQRSSSREDVNHHADWMD